MAAYEFSVTKSILQVDNDDQVDGNTAYGHIGPDRGTDTFQISGNVTEFTLAGPAMVSVNGEIVDADSVIQASGTTTTTIETTTTETATTTTDTLTTTTTTTATEEPTTTTTTTTEQIRLRPKRLKKRKIPGERKQRSGMV